MQCFQDLLLLHDQVKWNQFTFAKGQCRVFVFIFFYLYQVLDNFRNSPQLVVAKVSMDQYVSVLLPAVDWILQCLVHRGEHLHYTLHLISSIPLLYALHSSKAKI